jgi:hypothetical protein
MARSTLCALVWLAAATASAEPATLRLDYFHFGDVTSEGFSLDEVVLEGPWPGPADGSIDETNLGKYAFEVRDLATNRQLYSRGFASVFGEWETTSEARSQKSTLHESLRFPEPAGKVQVLLKKRGPGHTFREIWSVVVDPQDPSLDRTGASADAKVWTVMKNGPPRAKVDLLLLGDGYTAEEMEKWHADARRLTETLFAVSPFKERRLDFNVWVVDTPSPQSGVARPSDGIHRRSALRVRYDAFGTERYVLGFDNKRIREAAAAAPYEFLAIVVNDRKYGGGGIHHLYATVAADNAFTPYTFVHELGHHIAGLADEYYGSSVAYESPDVLPEPWEWNVTADPRASKWADLIHPDTPLPTPWPKQEMEAAQKTIQARRRELRAQRRPEAEMEALFAEERTQMTKLLGEQPHAGVVGAFEGAMYQAQGYYRPQADCIMFSRDEVGFCAVCRRALDRVFDQYAR